MEIVVDEVRKRGYVIDWIDFIQSCREKGWNEKTIRSRILFSVREIFGQEYHDKFEKKLDKYL